MRKFAFIALLLPFFASAEWVSAPGCHVPDANHEMVAFDLVPHMGRYKTVSLEAAGVPPDAIVVELFGELSLEREGEGSCSAWVGVAGSEAAPDQGPYVAVHGNEWQKTQSWAARVVPQDGTVTLRLMKTQNNPVMKCGIDATMTVARWCR